MTELGLLGARIVFHEYLLEDVPNSFVITPDNYNSGVKMVERVCASLLPGQTGLVLGMMLNESRIQPAHYGPWKDYLRWERMRGFVDGISRHCVTAGMDWNARDQLSAERRGR